MSLGNSNISLNRLDWNLSSKRLRETLKEQIEQKDRFSKEDFERKSLESKFVKEQDDQWRSEDLKKRNEKFKFLQKYRDENKQVKSSGKFIWSWPTATQFQSDHSFFSITAYGGAVDEQLFVQAIRVAAGERTAQARSSQLEQDSEINLSIG